MAEAADKEIEAAAPVAISKVVAGGDTLTLACPAGSVPEVKVGDLLPSATDATFFISSVKDQSFVVGPLKVGVHELRHRCSDGSEFATSIEVPEQDPQKLPPKEGPLGLIAFSLWWLWVLIALVLAIAAISAFWYRHKKKQISRAIKLRESLAKPQARDSLQMLRDMSALLDQLERDPSTAAVRADELYQKGYRSIRGFIEKELKLKTQAETTPQFIGSLKIAGAKHQIPSDLLGQIERSLVISDHNRFGAASTDSPESRKNYITELKKILQELIRLGQQWRAQPSPTSPTRKAGGKSK